eukprot:gnl/Dysnectes_brevis/7015_a11379_387.p1 GENE.gnl/Dysnectes_brevis/7015_a11379_387~~gnl/Dysnectes_brevis/7015_a11379_387.p1  ORF type:complete len:233 (+),score=11.34 gnl/Dysnectes_brevis/7015_a11379_387:112-810(+)
MLHKKIEDVCFSLPSYLLFWSRNRLKMSSYEITHSAIDLRAAQEDQRIFLDAQEALLMEDEKDDISVNPAQTEAHVSPERRIQPQTDPIDPTRSILSPSAMHAQTDAAPTFNPFLTRAPSQPDSASEDISQSNPVNAPSITPVFPYEATWSTGGREISSSRHAPTSTTAAALHTPRNPRDDHEVIVIDASPEIVDISDDFQFLSDGSDHAGHDRRGNDADDGYQEGIGYFII